MTQNIPQKNCTSRWNINWINKRIRRSIRAKQRQYNKAKTSGKPEDWAKFKATRKECEHKKYIADILNIGDDITEEQQARTRITKKFRRYIKSKKQESSGVATLEVDGC
jgi:hypothetical protein